jgi:hypothetical protein
MEEPGPIGLRLRWCAFEVLDVLEAIDAAAAREPHAIDNPRLHAIRLGQAGRVMLEAVGALGARECCGRDMHVDAVPDVPVAEGRSVEELDISVRPYNVLKNHGLEQVADIEVLPDRLLLRMHNFGRHSLKEVRARVPYRHDPVAQTKVMRWFMPLVGRVWNSLEQIEAAKAAAAKEN